ncbi:hypothetical protein SDC9_76404 [bioreactor metagenome]|uniref:Uncharacterized protein n=1 Tax=bioreactor metagenome TaxID=1076179 RepID=A0A644YTR2_9ZZZZ
MAEKFKCSFCRREYDDPVSRAQCEIKCDQAKKKEAESERKERLIKEQRARKHEINDMAEKLRGLYEAYYRDYSSEMWIEVPDLFSDFGLLKSLFM